MSEESPSELHDGFFREAFSREPLARALLRTHLPPEVVAVLDLNVLEPLPGKLVDEGVARRECDLVFRTKLSGRTAYVLLLVEHQSTEDPLMPLRLLGYMVRLWEREGREPNGKLAPIVPLVVAQTGSRWRTTTRFEEIVDAADLPHSFIPRFEHLLLDLSRLAQPDPRLPEENLALAVLLAILHTNRVRSNELLNLLERRAGMLLYYRRVPETMSLPDVVMRYLLYSREYGNAEQIIEALHKAKEYQLEERAMTIREQLIKEGEARGEVKGQRTLILRFLRSRFPSAELEPIRERLELLSDPELLAEAHEAAMVSATPQEFMSKIMNLQ